MAETRRDDNSRRSQYLRQYARWEYGDSDPTWLIRSARLSQPARRKFRLFERLGAFVRSFAHRDSSDSA
ncbi:MAG: hypothetical protein V3W28_02435 [Thermoplasmata archaeon]